MRNKNIAICRNKEKRISLGVLDSLFDIDIHSGSVKWLNPRGTIKAGDDAGSVSRGYRRIKIGRRTYAAHRLVWLYSSGSFPDGIIDHINGNKLDNSIHNLRDVDYATNNRNRKVKPSNCKHKLLPIGVSFHADCKTKPYYAGIRVKGRAVHLGAFKTIEEASRKYICARTCADGYPKDD